MTDYTTDSFDSMFANAPRAEPFLAAVRAAMRGGGVLVEIGTGVGYFAVAAARAGARHVYAIEMNDAVGIGPEVAAANGCADRITFVRGHSARVTLPERGDVLLEDIRGLLPMMDDHIPSVIDARARHLRPGATIIAARDTLWAAPCEGDARFVANHVAPGNAPHGIDRTPVDALVRQQFYRGRIEPGQLLAPPAEWGAIEYATVTSADVGGRAEWTVARAGRAEGFCVWFDSDLGFGARITNAPGAPRTVYGHAFFPLAHAIDVAPGDRIELDIRAAYTVGAYVYSWNTTVTPVSGNGRRPERLVQTNLRSVLPPEAQLARRRGDHAPSVAATAPLVDELLGLAGGGRTLVEIAARLARAHPERFAAEQDALRFASRVLGAIEDASADGGRWADPTPDGESR